MPKNDETKPNTSEKSGEDAQVRIRKTALRQALAIEEKKKVKASVLDLALQAFDLPSDSAADPAKPSVQDLKIFSHCLELFSPTDLDELVEERNIDHRCGYALCPKPNRERTYSGGKIWNGKLGDGFAFVDRGEKEKWCSSECHDRNSFVRQQLSTEPAWLREDQAPTVRLLDEAGDLQNIPDVTVDAGSIERLKGTKQKNRMLEAERSENRVTNDIDDIAVIERETSGKSEPPRLENNELIEGLPTRQQKGRS